jgi:acyl-CoA synthetase (AMP-forming)/AMP-acid ligase II
MENISFNIADLVAENAVLHPHQRALVFPDGRSRSGKVQYTQLTFQQTQERIEELSQAFLQAGIKHGDRVCTFVTLSLDFMPIIFALYRIGAIVVLIDPGMGRAGLLSCVERIAPVAMVGVPKAMVATRFFPSRFKSLKIKVTVGSGAWFWGGYTLDSLVASLTEKLPIQPTTRDDEASILFTSGSTGPAKGVRYTHGIFEAQTRHIQTMYGFESGQIDLPCFPLFGLFSLAMGMTVVIPDMDPTKPAQAEPEKLIEAINDQGCTSAFASPSLWKNFARYCLANSVHLPSLQKVLSAGAPISPELHRNFKEIVSSGVEIFTPYGATESLPVASIGSAEVLGETASMTDMGKGTCVGRLAPNIEVVIIDVTDAPIELWSEVKELPTGHVGEICVCGPVVTTEYKEEPEHTRMAKIHDGERVWHRMGDVGYLDEAGRLWFCGRKSHRVICEDHTVLFSVPCEAIFNRCNSVFRSALVGVNGVPVIVLELEPQSECTSDVIAELVDLKCQTEATARIEYFLCHSGFPVDVRHNAKINRPILAKWAATQKLQSFL